MTIAELDDDLKDEVFEMDAERLQYFIDLEDKTPGAFMTSSFGSGASRAPLAAVTSAAAQVNAQPAANDARQLASTPPVVNDVAPKERRGLRSHVLHDQAA